MSRNGGWHGSGGGAHLDSEIWDVVEEGWPAC